MHPAGDPVRHARLFSHTEQLVRGTAFQIFLKSVCQPGTIPPMVKKKVQGSPAADSLTEARERFVAQWGAFGGRWGINRTMSQIHALLMIAPAPMTTDDVMAALRVSRGNAHMNLKELIAWGLARKVVVKGERKEFFEAEKDAWEIVRRILRQRKQKELDPVVAFLGSIEAETSGLKSADAAAFRGQVAELRRFAQLTATAADKLDALGNPRALFKLLHLIR